MEKKHMSRRDMLAAAGGAAGLAVLAAGARAADDKSAAAGSGKVLVVHDKEGKIIAIGQQVHPAGQKGPSLQNGTVANPKAGHYVAELEVPPEHANLKLNELGERFRVDVRGKKFVAK
jgi:hypothetical protein